jgi:uncharacterized protein (TIGR00645 family)
MVANNEQAMGPRAKPELLLEWVLFASRWLLAPLYLSMVSMLAAILVVFLRQLISQLPNLWAMESEQVILLTLSFIDLSLTANLLLIVIFAGYEKHRAPFERGAARQSAATQRDWIAGLEFLVFYRNPDRGHHAIEAILQSKDKARVGLADARRLFQHRVEQRGEIAGRGIDGLQHLGGRGLLRQRFAGFGQEPRILHRDHRLRRKVLQSAIWLSQNGRTSWR